jgi:hypothetical protein
MSAMLGEFGLPSGTTTATAIAAMKAMMEERFIERLEADIDGVEYKLARVVDGWKK